MTSAEICALSQNSLDRVVALKQKFDAAFEALVVLGNKEDLQKVEALQREIEKELNSPVIARNPEQISGRALIYIGKLEPGMFHKFPRSIEHVYTSFPERELQLESLQISGHRGSELRGLLQKNRVKLSDDVKNELRSSNFLTSKQPEEVDLIKLKVEDLGLVEYPNTDQIYARIAELGLELCPPEVGPYYRLTHLDQPMEDWLLVGMKPFTDQDGIPCIFSATRNANGLWLRGDWAKQGSIWRPERQFLFRVRRDT